MKTITSTLVLSAFSCAFHAIGFAQTAARLDPLARIPSANHAGSEKSAAFCGLPSQLDHSAAHMLRATC
jgi:hypothetical protein